MSAVWYYLFADPRYPLGVKFGRCKSDTAKEAWKAAPSYGPEGMIYLAVWRVELPCKTPDGSWFCKRAELEKHVFGRLLVIGPAMNTLPGHERAGREWVRVTPSQAIDAVTTALGRSPNAVDVHRGRPVTTNDNLRWPHPRNLRNYALGIGVKNRVKVALWIYEEGITGRLKTQFVHEWASPFERARRYSRNGFAERAAFGYAGAACPDANVRIHEAWRAAMTVFGPGPDDRRHGWLNEGATLADVEAFYSGRGLIAFPVVKSEVPEGIQPAYNKPYVAA